MSGGELFDFIIRRGKFSENDCRIVAKQLLEAVAYMHSVGIVHRDLKPENLLLGTPDNINDIRVCDFGQATFLRPWMEVERMNEEFASRKSLANTLGGTLYHSLTHSLNGKKKSKYTHTHTHTHQHRNSGISRT